MRRLRRGHCNNQSLWICKADVLRCVMHDSARDIHRVFAPFDHPSEPVEGGICV
jgi:hypothetical protein